MSAIHPSSTLSSCSHNKCSAVSVVFVFNTSLSALAPSAPISFPACWCLLLAMSAFHPSSSRDSCSLVRSKDLSVVFVFNTSLRILAPSSRIPLPACWCLVLAMPSIHKSSSRYSCSLFRFNDWSVVFVLSVSLSALVPSALIPLSNCWCWLLTMSEIHPSSSLFILLTSHIQ